MMQLKDILALRLRALMQARPDLDTQIKIHKRTELAQSTVQRILKREVHTGLDVLQILADGFGVDPLSLITPIDADKSETFIPSYDEKKLLLTWRKLADADKHKLMAYISVSNLVGGHASEAEEEVPDASPAGALSPDALRLAKWLDELPDGQDKDKAYNSAMMSITQAMHKAGQSAAPDAHAPPKKSAAKSGAQPAKHKTPATPGTDQRAQ